MAWESLSPREALKHYRLTSPFHIHQQVELFNKMTASEKMELLFFMISHTTNVVQYLHAKIDPEAAKTTDPRDIQGSNETH